MAWSDLFLTPLYLVVFYALAYWIRPYVTDRYTAAYFIPGYTVKIIGALALGAVYQFYYAGGDTYVFYHDSTIINNVIQEDFLSGIKLLYTSNRFDSAILSYAGRLYHFNDPSTYFIIKLAAILSFFAFNSYAVIACMFATISYSGLWNLYRTFYRLYPHLYKPLAYAVLFIPSVFFWGSGYLKDSITLAAVGWAVYCFYLIFAKKQNVTKNVIILIAAFYVLYVVKIYILLCILPALIVWIFLLHTNHIKSSLFRYVLTPVIMVAAGVIAFFAIQKIGEGSHRYSLEGMAATAEETARWLAYLGELQGGSVYSLGDFDYSTAGMLRKAIPAINVTLFRPYLWEVRNPIMLLSALESLFMFLFTGYVVYKKGVKGFFKAIGKDPFVLFCLIFAVSFSFAVGISTYNFGSLVRYKIPMMPFYITALLAIRYPRGRRRVVKRRRKLDELDATENRSSTVSRPRLPIAFRN